MPRIGSLAGNDSKDAEHEFLLGQKDPMRRNLPKHAQMMLSIIDAEHLDECENNFDMFDRTRKIRFIAMEFIGTFCNTLICAGSVMSTGMLTYQFGMEEQTAGRILAVAFSSGLSYTAVLYTAHSFLDNKYKRRNEILRIASMPSADVKNQENEEKLKDKTSHPEKQHKDGGSFRDFPCGHFNPAITFGMALTKTLDGNDTQIPPALAVSYIFSQICAAICATYFLSMVFNHLKIPQNPNGVPVPGDGVTVVGALLMETVLTFSLTMAILILIVRGEDTSEDVKADEPADDGRNELKKGREARGYIRDMAPLAIGLIYITLSILGIPISGASLNPARSFSAALMSGIWTEHWLYWVGPFLGSGCAALTYTYIIDKLEIV
jgi:glycerol uptake facilitator-like aquaporin